MSSFAYIDGKELTRFAKPLFSDNDLPYRTFGLASLETVEDTCTLRFDLDCVPEQAIETACAEVAEHRGPVQLSLYKAGWFEERFATAAQAIERIEQAAALKSVSIPGCFMSFRKKPEQIPGLFSVIRNNPGHASHLLTLASSDGDRGFPLLSVGSHSLMAGIMGKEWVVNGDFDLGPNATADRTVTRAYRDVLETMDVYYDEALVCLMPTDPEPNWMRYHRLIWPVQKPDGEIQLANLCIKLDNGLDYLLGPVQ
ncbi:MAG: hypothetical protein GY948_05465 [Alphaproteobacteria bacterium]|nr:hypothetical protein [Alphaproteobacteria bacterium]